MMVTIILYYKVSGGWGSLCTFVRTYVVLLMVESNIVLFRPLCEVLDSVPSLHIQWYSGCFSHCSLFSSVVGAWVRMCMVIVFLSCLFSSMCLHTGLFSSVRCSISLCLHALCVYPTYCVLQLVVLHVIRYTTFFDEQL